MTYELHPLCTLFPRLTGAEFDALRDDIGANGLQSAIVLHGGLILDGGNRYRACIEAGVEPVFTEFDGDNLVSFVLSSNLHRRHMSAGQQAAIVASAQDWAKAQTHGGSRRGDQAATLPLETVKQRAAESGASERTQRMADKVAKESPDLAKKVAHGEISLPKAVEQVAPKQKKAPPEPVAHDNSDDLAEARHALADLAEENEQLRTKLAIEQMDASEEAKSEAAQIITDLRAENATLRRNLAVTESQLNNYMSQSAELMKQNASLTRRLKKAEATA